MGQLLALAARNVMRNRRRSMLAAAAVLFGVFALLCIKSMLNGAIAAQRASLVERFTGAVQVHRRGYQQQVLGSPLKLAFDLTPELRTRLLGIPHVTGISGRLTFGAMLNANDTTVVTLVSAFDPGDEYRVCPGRRDAVTQGLPVDNAAPSGVLPTAALARRLQWQPGQQGALLSGDADGVLNGVDVSLRGASGPPNIPGQEARVLTMPLVLAQQLLRLPGRVTEVVLAVDDLEQADAVAAAATAALGGDYEVHTWDVIAPFVKQEERNQRRVFNVLVFIFILAALLGVTNTTLVNMLERTREIGTMLAVGTRRRRIIVLFVLEGGLLGLLGCAAGLGAALLVIAVTRHFGIHLNFIGGSVLHIYPFVTVAQAAGLTALCGVGAMVAALGPAWRASRLSPARALMGMET